MAKAKTTKAKAKKETTTSKAVRETTAAPKAEAAPLTGAGKRVAEHMKKHSAQLGEADPWSAVNAGFICGYCGERI